MQSFNNSTIRVLLTGALVLGGGIYYRNVAAQRVDEANQALRGVDSARSQLEVASERVQRYNSLLESMADRNVDRQEPFAVVSEFSPQEIKKIGPLLDTLYQRDGYFFLEHFQLSWRKQPGQASLPPKVVLDLEGRKVLLFSDGSSRAPSLALVNQ